MDMSPDAGGSQMVALLCPSCHSKGPGPARPHLHCRMDLAPPSRAVMRIEWGDVCKELCMCLTLNGCLVNVSRFPKLSYSPSAIPRAP